MRLVIFLTAAFFSPLICHQAFAEDFSSVLRLGGETTILLRKPTVQAYRNPAQNLSAHDLALHMDGDKLFEKTFSDDPDRKDYGLGPVFNNISCMACHIVDGRGALPVLGLGKTWTKLSQSEAIFLRISLARNKAPTFDSRDNWGAPIPVPGFGTQLFHLGSYGVRDDLPGTGQAQVFAMLEWSSFTYPDGTQVQLHKPIFKIESPYDFSGLNRLNQSDVRAGARMTPPMIGLGLLEAVREKDILALAKRDLRKWGIFGHPNWVIDRAKELAGDPTPVSLGRFGLKANTPSVLHQSAGALRGDLGVTNPFFPAESIEQTPLFDAFKSKWRPGVDATEDLTNSLIFYSQTLAVPSRRDIDDPEVREGAKKFIQVGCANCHNPSFVTGRHPIASLSLQRIYPFTDMLLHDMGEGLADDREDFQASGREWRTRALWGIGLTQVVNQRAGFLHDGRASTLEEAILWHAGEGEVSRARFAALTQTERASVIRFLESL